VEQQFDPQDVVEYADCEGREFARGIVNCASNEATALIEETAGARARAVGTGITWCYRSRDESGSEAVGRTNVAEAAHRAKAAARLLASSLARVAMLHESGCQCN